MLDYLTRKLAGVFYLEESPYLVEKGTLAQVYTVAGVLGVSPGEVFRDSLKLGLEQMQVEER